MRFFKLFLIGLLFVLIGNVAQSKTAPVKDAPSIEKVHYDVDVGVIDQKNMIEQPAVVFEYSCLPEPEPLLRRAGLKKLLKQYCENNPIRTTTLLAPVHYMFGNSKINLCRNNC